MVSHSVLDSLQGSGTQRPIDERRSVPLANIVGKGMSGPIVSASRQRPELEGRMLAHDGADISGNQGHAMIETGPYAIAIGQSQTPALPDSGDVDRSFMAVQDDMPTGANGR